MGAGRGQAADNDGRGGGRVLKDDGQRSSIAPLQVPWHSEEEKLSG